MVVQLNEETGQMGELACFDHPYPTTKIMWIPDKTGSRTDLIATTGDYLRLWEVNKGGSSVSMKMLLNNVRLSYNNPFFFSRFDCFQNKNSEFCAPLTSFDWNETDPSIVGTSSIDTTCTIWNVEVPHHPQIQVCIFLTCRRIRRLAMRRRN